ncbi:hypothetical protein D029_1991B, partial [Vibrio parahaemolyticus 970107]
HLRSDSLATWLSYCHPKRCCLLPSSCRETRSGPNHQCRGCHRPPTLLAALSVAFGSHSNHLLLEVLPEVFLTEYRSGSNTLPALPLWASFQSYYLVS